MLRQPGKVSPAAFLGFCLEEVAKWLPVAGGVYQPKVDLSQKLPRPMHLSTRADCSEREKAKRERKGQRGRVTMPASFVVMGFCGAVRPLTITLLLRSNRACRGKWSFPPVWVALPQK